MLHLNCEGSPYEVGKQHGSGAPAEVKRSIKFYEGFFYKKASFSWAQVEQETEKWLPYLESTWPSYVEEMKGVADGAGVNFLSVVALNIRAEISHGLASDACTAFAWKTENEAFIGQNWDWEAEQAETLISLRISLPNKPRIHMITEGGIIGKIGLNSQGVGVTLNAVRAKGVDRNKLPVHLALRTVLESESQAAARQTLLNAGVAASSHITICDFPSGAVGMECTARDIVQLQMEDGICVHSNHMIRPHIIPDVPLVEDSPFRLKRMKELLLEIGSVPTMDSLRNMLKDEKNYPGAICRTRTEDVHIETLFSIVMDVKEKYAMVKMGRPTANGEVLELRP